MIPFARIVKYGNKVQPLPDITIKDLQTGQNHNGLLMTDGTFYVQGLNNNSQCGQSSTTDDVVNYINISTNVKMISIGYNVSIYITNSNQIFGTGKTATITGTDLTTWTNITTWFSTIDIPNIKLIRLASDGAFILMNDGSLYSRGTNVNFSVNATTSAWKKLYTANVVDVRCGYDFTNILVQDEIIVLGKNGNGQLGTGNTTTYQTQTSTGIKNVQSIYSSYSNSYYMTVQGLLYGCGSQNQGQLGTGITSATNQLTYTRVGQAAGGLKVLGHGFFYGTGNVFLTTNGSVWVCGNNPGLGLGGTAVNTFTNVQYSVKFSNVCMMANGMLLHDGNNIYGSGNSRLLPGLSNNTQITQITKCIMPKK